MVAGSSGLRSAVPTTPAFGSHVHLFFSCLPGEPCQALQPPAHAARCCTQRCSAPGYEREGFLWTGYYHLVRLFTKDSHSAPVGSVWEGQHCRHWGDGNRSTQKLAAVEDCVKRCLYIFKFWKDLKTKSCGWEMSNNKVPPGSLPRILSRGFPKDHINMYFFLSFAYLSPSDWSYVRSCCSLFSQVCSHQLIWATVWSVWVFEIKPLKILLDHALCPRANSLLISTNHREITFGKYCWCTGHFKTVFSITMWFVENIVINIILHKRSMAKQKTLSNPVLCHMPY